MGICIFIFFWYMIIIQYPVLMWYRFNQKTRPCLYFCTSVHVSWNMKTIGCYDSIECPNNSHCFFFHICMQFIALPVLFLYVIFFFPRNMVDGLQSVLVLTLPFAFQTRQLIDPNIYWFAIPNIGSLLKGLSQVHAQV